MSEDMVNHPLHYGNHASGVECIDLIEWLGMNRGTAVKYLWRKDDKGKPREDTEKALWYALREMSRRRTVADRIPDLSAPEPAPPAFVQEYYRRWMDAEPDGWRRSAVARLYEGRYPDLERSVGLIQETLTQWDLDTQIIVS